MNLGQKVSLLVIAAIIVGGYLYYENQFQTNNPEYNLVYDEELNYTYYKNYGESRYLVDRWTLRYYHTNWTEPRPCTDYGPFSVVIETPKDNMVLEISGKQVTPSDAVFVFPLVVYHGNAYSFESPEIWRENTTCSQNLAINFEKKGAYTICLTGYVSGKSHRFSLRSHDPLFETVLIYVDLQLRNSEDEISRYIVDNDIWDH
jgi:hypothetical protein